MLPSLLLHQNPRQHCRSRSQQPSDVPKLKGLPLLQGFRFVEDADARCDNQAEDAQDKERHRGPGKTEALMKHGHIEKVREAHGSGGSGEVPIALISADVTKTCSSRVLHTAVRAEAFCQNGSHDARGCWVGGTPVFLTRAVRRLWHMGWVSCFLSVQAGNQSRSLA